MTKPLILSIPQDIVAALPQDTDPKDAIRQIISAALGVAWPSAGRRSTHGLNAAQVTYLGRLLARDPDMDPREARRLAAEYVPRKRRAKGDDAPETAAPAETPQRPRKRVKA